MTEKKSRVEDPGIKPIWVVRLDLDSSREADINKWYNQIHLPDMIQRMPGVTGVTRYECIMGRRANPKYLSITEIESESILKQAINSAESIKVGEDFPKTWPGGLTIGSMAAYRPIYRVVIDQNNDD